MRIACPPTTHSCFYGVDTPDRDKLLAAYRNVEQMRQVIGTDSLAFISIDGLYRAMEHAGLDAEHPQYCDACFTGNYPTRLTDQEEPASERQLSLLAEGI